MSFAAEYAHVARKAWVCEWCGEAIEPGVLYTLFKGKGDGGFFEVRYHPECNSALNTAWVLGLWGFFCPDHGGLVSVRDHPRGRVGSMCRHCGQRAVGVEGQPCAECASRGAVGVKLWTVYTKRGKRLEAFSTPDDEAVKRAYDGGYLSDALERLVEGECRLWRWDGQRWVRREGMPVVVR